MSPYPYAIVLMVAQHQQELISDADQHRLLTAARRARRNRRGGGDAELSTAVRDHPATAVPCTA